MEDISRLHAASSQCDDKPQRNPLRSWKLRGSRREAGPSNKTTPVYSFVFSSSHYLPLALLNYPHTHTHTTITTTPSLLAFCNFFLSNFSLTHLLFQHYSKVHLLSVNVWIARRVCVLICCCNAFSCEHNLTSVTF